MNRPVAIVSFAQRPAVRRESRFDETEMVQDVVSRALDAAHATIADVGFVCSGSSDFLVGRPFSFVTVIDALGAWPPVSESHVEMDGAFALYEAWVRLQHGDVDVALVYAFGRSSMGDLRSVSTAQLDPYLVAGLGLDSISLAALQARALLEAGTDTEANWAKIAMDRRRAAAENANAQLRTSPDVETLLREPYLTSPLRKHDCPPISDGAAAMVLVGGDRAFDYTVRPVWIRGIDHRAEPHTLGLRTLTDSTSTRLAAERAGAYNGPPPDVLEFHAPFTSQDALLQRVLPIGPNTAVNPSGGALAAHPLMVAGLTRVGEAASRLVRGDGLRAVAHATSGPLLQQNLVAVLEVDP
ncbi:MAG: lipid-transfer protein [Myxococcales bacterium]|nr:lipid-transfer protein [Myxococcales bacterium]